MMHGIKTVLGWATVGLLCLSTIAGGEASLETALRQAWDRLGSRDLDERESGTAEIRNLLNGMAHRRDEKGLAAALGILAGYARASADPEILERWKSLSAPFRAGALAWSSGEKLPRNPREARLFRSPNGDFVFARGENWIGRYDAETGDAQWERTELPGAIDRLEIQENLLLVMGDSWCAGYEIETGRPVFNRQRLPESVRGISVKGNTLIAWGNGKNAWVGAYDLASEKVLWERKEFPGHPWDRGSNSALIDGRVAWEAGRVLIHSQDLTGRPWAACCLLADGKPLWTWPPGWFPGLICKSEFLSGQKRIVLFGSRNHRPWVGCYDVDTCKPVWEWKPDHPMVGGQSCVEGRIADGMLFVWSTSDSGQTRLGRFDPASGKLLWERCVDCHGKQVTVRISGQQVVVTEAVAQDEIHIRRFEGATGKQASERKLKLEELPGAVEGIDGDGDDRVVTGNGEYRPLPGGFVLQTWVAGYDFGTGKPQWIHRFLGYSQLDFGSKIILGCERDMDAPDRWVIRGFRRHDCGMTPF